MGTPAALLRHGGHIVSAQIKWSKFKPWTATLCCVLGQDTASDSASLHPGEKFNFGGNPVMD